MCGRYVSPADAAIELEYDLRGVKAERFIRETFKANYNVSPTQQVPIMRKAVRLDAEGILAKNDEETWLTGTEDQALALLKQFPSERMEAWPVKGKTVSDSPLRFDELNIRE